MATSTVDRIIRTKTKYLIYSMSLSVVFGTRNYKLQTGSRVQTFRFLENSNVTSEQNEKILATLPGVFCRCSGCGNQTIYYNWLLELELFKRHLITRTVIYSRPGWDESYYFGLST